MQPQMVGHFPQLVPVNSDGFENLYVPRSPVVIP